MKSVDVIIPAFNEEECVEELTRRLGLLFDAEKKYKWRAIIVENGSKDRTWPLLQEITEADPRITVVRLSRNFGMDGGLTAGLAFAVADAVVFMTADLQDPPEAISLFLREWEKGADNVYGLVTERQGTSLMRRLNSRAFYAVANSLTKGRLTKNASDFRLMDRRLYEALRELSERNRFMRGLVAWAGFESVAVPVPRPPRFGGKSKAYSWTVIDLAMRAIFAHSYVPIRAISILGFLAAVGAVVAFIVMAIFWLTLGVPFPGFGTIVSLVLLVFGSLTLILGVIAEYIALIYEEVKGRPNFIVWDTIGVVPPKYSR
ncbi:MAG: glycosyltransferase family 2 protein [Rhodoglobus sp.]|nr:glycosyltransferase family 2 protein [Rhodoglobus sp.]